MPAKEEGGLLAIQPPRGSRILLQTLNFKFFRFSIKFPFMALKDWLPEGRESTQAVSLADKAIA